MVHIKNQIPHEVMAAGFLSQVRVFNVHIRRFLCTEQEKRGGGGSKGGPPALAGTKEYEQSDRNQ